ncbi:MAG TPA: LysM domain-containing protein [Mobilitalea sp.]|nr:LysM domain-containing protein [Mobilitalea sp.]
MIESVYSNENGEDNRTNRLQSNMKMPKNIRQVGKSNAIKKIYVEDYVMTFIKQLSGEDYSKCKVAVLIGQYIKLENCRNIFISGAVEVEDIDTSGEIIFSNDIWTKIYEDIKKYFVDAEIVGWFIGGPGYLLDDEDKILKTHIDNFAGQDKTLLTFDNMEKEETFLFYENNHLSKQDGYYIYYEKNDEMQTYMIEHKKTQSEEVTFDDRVSREIRTVIQNRKPPVEENKSVTRLMYAAGTLLAVIILVVGAAMLSNYEQMKNMQNTLNYLTKNLNEAQTLFSNDSTSGDSSNQTDKGQTGDKQSSDSQTPQDSSTQDANSDNSNLDVEVVPGEVKPLDNGNENNNDEDLPVTDEELAGNADNTQQDTAATTDKNTQNGNDTVKQTVNYYTVKSGDTLAGISLKLYKSVNYVKKIMDLNGIADQDVIYVGQKLIIP